MATHTAISSLGPDSITGTPAASIRAVVTLVWPYSSTTRQCALLLAEEDFRLRQARGQVRVRFSGPAATALAKSGLGIADVVELRLQGARWIDRDHSVRTPGKSVDGEIVFSRSLDLTVLKDGKAVAIRVDEPTAQAEEQLTHLSSLHTPMKIRTGTPFEGLHYSSPVFSHASASPSLDPFLDDDVDDLEDERARKRVRTSFGPNKQWRLANKSPSPVQSTSHQSPIMTAAREHSTTSEEAAMSVQDVHNIDIVTSAAQPEADVSITTGTSALSSHETTQGLPLAGEHGLDDVLPSSLSDEAMLSSLSALRADKVPPQDIRSHRRHDGTDGDSKVPVQATAKKPNDTTESRAPQLVTVTTLGPGNTMKRTMTSLFGFSNTSSAAQAVSAAHTAAQPSVSDLELAFQDVRDPFPELREVQDPFPELREVQEPFEELQEIQDPFPELREIDEAFEDFREVESDQSFSGSRSMTENVQQPDDDLYTISEAAASPEHAEAEAVEPSRAESMPPVATTDLHADLDSRQTTFDQWLRSEPISTLDSSNCIRIITHLAAGGFQAPDASTTDGSPLTSALLSPSLQIIQQIDTGEQADKSNPTKAEDIVPKDFVESTNRVNKGLEEEALGPIAKTAALQPGKVSPSGSSIRNFFREQRRLSDLKLAAKRLSTASSTFETVNMRPTGTVKEAPRPMRKLKLLAQPSGSAEHDDVTQSAHHQDAKDKKSESKLDMGHIIDKAAQKPVLSRASDKGKPQLITQQSGIRTDSAYYRLLSALPRYVNPRGYVAFGEDCVDIIAVVSSATKEPARAKTGPLDHYTSLAIMDESSTDSKSTSVDVFRPHKKSLPVAEEGDVVLLRAFAVKSRNRAPYLMSTDASAWCVWRFSQQKEDDLKAVEEQVRGPEVEYNVQERNRVVALRQWWHSQQIGGDEPQSTGAAAISIVSPT